MQKVVTDHAPDQPASAKVWAVLAIISFVLVATTGLAIWLIVLEEKANRGWRAAEAAVTDVAVKSPEPKDDADDGTGQAHEEIAVAKKAEPASLPILPPIKEGEPVQEAPSKEGVKVTDDVTAPALPPKKAAPERDPKDEIGIGSDGWFEVNCVGGKFQMLVPGVPMVQRALMPRALQPGDEYQARHAAAELIFRGSSFLMPRDSEEIDPAAADYLKSSIVRLLPRPAYELKRDQEIKHDGQAGREFVVEGLGGIKMVGRHFRVLESAGQARIFCFTVTGPAASLNAPDVKKFFQSVKMYAGANSAKNGATAAAADKQTPSETKAPGADARPNTPNTSEVKKQPPKISPIESANARGVVGIRPIPGKLSAHVGAVIDIDAKSVVLFLPAGLAKLYAYPEFQALGVYKLTAGAAHRPIYDKASGRLFVLAPSAQAKDPAGKPGGSRVAVYDFRDLLDGKLSNNAQLTPAKVFPLHEYCSQLCVSVDGAWLYALEAGKTSRAVRFSAATGELAGAAALPEFTTSIALAKDGKRLYALSHLTARNPKAAPPRGALLVINPETMMLQKTVGLPLDPFEMQPAEESMVFISGHGGVRGEIIVVDTAKELSLVASWKSVPPSASLKLSDDERTLFVASWKALPPSIGAFDVPSSLAGSETPPGQWVQTPSASARGEMVITPDNRYLLCDSGAVFYLRDAEQGPK